MADRIPWAIKGTWIEACNCDYGCPCNFSGIPSKGYCEAVVGFKVESGSHGDVPLDGVIVVSAVSWPGPIHEGKGKLAVFIDEKTNEAQCQALVRILTAQDGGMPWEILAATVEDFKGPYFVPLTFDDKGTKTTVSAEGISVQLAPFTNPVTGEENEVHTVLPGGFIWGDGSACKADTNNVKLEGLEFDWAGQNAYWAKVDWSNAEFPEAVAGTKF